MKLAGVVNFKWITNGDESYCETIDVDFIFTSIFIFIMTEQEINKKVRKDSMSCSDIFSRPFTIKEAIEM